MPKPGYFILFNTRSSFSEHLKNIDQEYNSVKTLESS